METVLFSFLPTLFQGVFALLVIIILSVCAIAPFFTSSQDDHPENGADIDSTGKKHQNGYTSLGFLVTLLLLGIFGLAFFFPPARAILAMILPASCILLVIILKDRNLTKNMDKI